MGGGGGGGGGGFTGILVNHGKSAPAGVHVRVTEAGIQHLLLVKYICFFSLYYLVGHMHLCSPYKPCAT